MALLCLNTDMDEKEDKKVQSEGLRLLVDMTDRAGHCQTESLVNNSAIVD